MFFSIDDEVFGKLPALFVGVVLAEGVDGMGEHPAVEALLGEAVRDAERRLEGIHASDDPRVQPYREAFHELGMSPSRYPSSNIALLRRIAKGKGLWRVNPVVDLGNAISIKYGLPLGAHALGEKDVLELRFSRQSENGKVEPSTTRIAFPIDGFTGTNEDEVRAACEELVSVLRDELGATAQALLATAGSSRL